MVMKNRLICVLSIICIIANTIIVPVFSNTLTDNLIINPGFESGNWQVMKNASIDSSIHHFGSKSVKLQSPGAETYCYSNDIQIDITSSYTLNAWIKTDNVKGASVRIQFLDKNKANISPMRTLICANETQDWAKYNADVQSFNEGTKYIRIYCYIDSDADGEAWFDDFSLTENENLIQNPSFENGKWQNIQNAVIDKEVSHLGSNSLKLSSSDANVFNYSCDISVDIKKTYAFEIWMKTQNAVADSISIRIQYLNSNLENISPMRKLIVTGGTQDWTKYSCEISSYNEGTAYIRIFCYLETQDGAVAWFDDASLKENKNLINNSGFEFGNWALSQSGTIDTSNVYNGRKCAKLIGSEIKSYYGTHLIQVDNLRTYNLSGWIKTDDISDSDGAYIQVQQISYDKTNLGMGSKKIFTGGTKDWTHYSVYIDNLYENTAYVRIYVLVGENVTGTAWFDDVVFEEERFSFSTQTPSGNIYKPTDKMHFNFNIQNYEDVETTVNIFYTIKDYEENVLYQGSKIAELLPEQSCSQLIDLSFMQTYGTYTIELYAQDEYGGEITYKYYFSRVSDDNSNQQNDMFGMCTHFAHSGKGDCQINLPLIAQTGAEWIRDEMYWGALESQKGQYDVPEKFEKYVDAAISNKINVLLVLNGDNPLYGSMPPSTDEAIEAYAQYCSFVAEHFKGRINHFEIWNEYNNEGFNKNGEPPETYAKMIKAAYTAIKNTNPEAFVVGGCTSRVDLEWLKRVFEAGGHAYMDAVSVHPYCYPESPDYTFIQNLTKVHNLIKEYGEDKPVWVTEIGYPTHNIGSSERASASNLVKTYILALTGNVAQRVFWYDFQDDGLLDDNKEHHFGIIRSNKAGVNAYTAKEPYVAHTNLISQLKDLKFIEENSMDKIRIFKFKGEADNKDVFIIWSLSESGYINLKTNAKQLNCYDLMGNDILINRYNDLFTLKVSKEPVYLTGEFSDSEIKYCITDPNLIINPGFEESGWSIAQNANIDYNISNGGNKSAMFNAAETESYFGTNLIPIDKDSIYNLSVWIKTDNVPSSDGAFLQVQQIDENKNNLGMGSKLISTGNSHDWTQYNLVINNLNTNTAYVRVYVKLASGIQGTAWFDDVSFVKLQDDIQLYMEEDTGNKMLRGTVWTLNEVKSPVLLAGFYDGQKLNAINNLMLDSLKVGSNHIELKLDLHNNYKTNRVKMFLWDTASSIKPISNYAQILLQ